jgi:hypothetical protein
MNEKELKMGDTVEVCIMPDNEWKSAIFVKYGCPNNSIIVVSKDDEFLFKDGFSFNTEGYTRGTWRIPKQKTYRPFTFKEAETQLLGKCIKLDYSYIAIGHDCFNKSMKHEVSQIFGKFIITEIYPDGVIIGRNSSITSYYQLYERYVFLNESPCGVME